MLVNWVDQDDSFAQLCLALDDESVLALDTEFHRESTYYPEFCLLQIASSAQISLVDVLNITRLTSLWDLISRASVTTVFHSAFQDLEIIYRNANVLPATVFDTQLAAAMLGWGEQLGYTKLIERLFGATTSKDLARTNWRQRPLTPDQTKYAADDVRYLAEIYLLQVEALREQGKESWLREETIKRYHVNQFIVKPEDAWKSVTGRRYLKPEHLPILAAAAAWRENVAQKRNLPRRWIIEDRALLVLARNAPDTLVGVSKLGLFKPRLLEDFGEDLIRAIVFARDQPRPEEWSQPNVPALTGSQKNRFASLSAQIRELAVQLQIAPTLLSTRAELERVARGEANVFESNDWRRQVLLPILRQHDIEVS